jgi:hypothetical protein
MADLQSTNPMPQPKANTPVTERPPFPLAHSFARESQKDPELALVFALWPKLPEPLRKALARWPEIPEAIRRAILALLEAVPN